MNTYAFVEAYLEMINLKISFLWSLAICFCLDISYWDSWVFVSLLVNTSNLFNKNIILTCFGCFLDYLQPDLFTAKNTNIGIAYTKSIYK